MTRELYDKLWGEVEKAGTAKPDVFSHFEIPDFISSGSTDVTETYLNYKKEHKQLLTQFISFLNKKTKGTKKILIVGPSGSGKTSFFFFFQKSFTNLLRRNKIDEKIYDIPRTMFAASARTLTIKETLKQIERNEKRFFKSSKKNIIFVDDIQEVLCPVITYSKEHQRTKEAFWKKIDRYENCFVILSSTPYNWFQTKKLNPEVAKKFNEIIILEGLNENHLNRLSNERVYSHFKDPQIIPEEVKAKIVDDANSNPRLLLRIIHKTLEVAFKNKQTKISIDKHPVVQKETGLYLIAAHEKLSNAKKELLLELTSLDELSATDISEKTNLTRSTISQYLNELERENFLLKRKIKKEVRYALRFALKTYLEKKMILEEKTERTTGN